MVIEVVVRFDHSWGTPGGLGWTDILSRWSLTHLNLCKCVLYVTILCTIAQTIELFTGRVCKA